MKTKKSMKTTKKKMKAKKKKEADSGLGSGRKNVVFKNERRRG